MKVLGIRPLEDCFDGSFIKEMLLDGAIDADFIHYLGRLGELQYFPMFARPFFRIDDRRRFSVQGIEGNRTLRVTLCRDGLAHWLSELTQLIDAYEDRSP